VLTVVCLGLLLSMYNATVVNVMLPDIPVSLHASGTGLAWVAALYSLDYAALLMAGGALGARVGKRAFLGGVAVFTVGSAACAAAPGLAFLPMTILMALLGPVAGRLSARFSVTSVMVAGLLLAAAGSLSLALPPAGGSAVDLGWRFALIGLGAGLMNSPMSNAAVSGADARHSGAASATHNTFRQVGGTLGVAALGTIVAAGHHPTADAAAFGAGLGHAFTAVAALLALCAVVVAVLGRKRSHGRHSGAPRTSRPHRVMTSSRAGHNR
jgi:MFS family permease